ncbi:succinate dehydrogenase assembly factor 2 [Azospira restricta]|uniref:FAD assembly factor SdhE n=1 Tax=Azospira restricta TaxID=404405 RepID=A0A974PXA0_9RHOO|nr:succinate dehydrogenase assembly factor 2 [Azospira restricta]QRJ63031.1 succinate dehydrogenase assembly factor 2 [Azospira restricta]
MDHDALNRLQWRCTRRALLELDLILGKFLVEEFPKLSDADQHVFAELADMEDHDLWPLVNGTEECEDARQAGIVALLRKSEVRQPL